MGGGEKACVFWLGGKLDALYDRFLIRRTVSQVRACGGWEEGERACVF